MALLAGKTYDPATAVSHSTAVNLAMTALDTANLRLTFTVPVSGSVLVRLKGTQHGNTTFAQILLGVMDAVGVVARVTPHMVIGGTSLATTRCHCEALFVVTGLVPAASLTWDAAYGVEVAVATTGLKYGGPDSVTANDAFGAFQFEVWAA